VSTDSVSRAPPAASPIRQPPDQEPALSHFLEVLRLLLARTSSKFRLLQRSALVHFRAFRLKTLLAEHVIFLFGGARHQENRILLVAAGAHLKRRRALFLQFGSIFRFKASVLLAQLLADLLFLRLLGSSAGSPAWIWD
jgi:hypothetical protein